MFTLHLAQLHNFTYKRTEKLKGTNGEKKTDCKTKPQNKYAPHKSIYQEKRIYELSRVLLENDQTELNNDLYIIYPMGFMKPPNQYLFSTGFCCCV